MRLVLFWSVWLLVVTAQMDNGQSALDAEWELFKKEYNKTYANSSEEARRKQIFEDNLEKIERQNQLFDEGNSTFTMGINQFADMTNEEFKEQMLSYLWSPYEPWETLDQSVTPVSKNTREEPPLAVDWRNTKCLGKVENQLKCGSCWAFTAVGSIESIKCIKSGGLVELSEQQLIDCCSWIYGNYGCEGGLVYRAYLYLATSSDGLETDANYPYEAKDGTCQLSSNYSGVQITGYIRVPEGDEAELLRAVTQQPVAVGIDAIHDSFQLYKGGIFYEESCVKEIDLLSHTLLVVGFGTDNNGTEYWIAQNSWGTGWGEDGYMRLPRNKNNHCGIATQACYPLYE